MFEFGWHDWAAVVITALTVSAFIVLLVVDAYTTYIENERRRIHRGSSPKKEACHG